MIQLDTDVAIIGGGTAGISAAVAAAEKGARVSVFEKAATTGGAGNLAQGPFAVESRLQRARQIALTREEAFKIHMDYTHWRVDARLVKVYIDKSADTIDWLEAKGIEFSDVRCHSYGFSFTWHIVKSATGDSEHGDGAHLMKTLTEKAQELGARIFLRTPAKRILKEKGQIAGVVAEDSAGEEIQANARAVIIASGGFGDNPDMIKKYTGYEWGKDIFSLRVPGVTGDGIRMAWAVDAAPTEMTMHMVQGVPGIDMAESLILACTFQHPNLMVNLLGERFMNEETVINTTFAGNTISRQKNRCAVMIFDESIRKYYEETGFDFPPGGMNKATNLGAALQQAIDRKNENIFITETLEELAAKAGIDREALIKTVDEYNRACATGHDGLFNKNSRYLRPVKQPRFYAGRIFPGALGTLGGIRINYKTEVLNKEHDVIPGLYAAGLDANSIYGDSYIFILPGNTLGFAINSGRMAGENAAEFVTRR